MNAGLEVLRKLQPVTYTWKDSGQRDLGLVAEQVHAVYPLLATYNATGQVEGVKYDRLPVLLINAVSVATRTDQATTRTDQAATGGDQTTPSAR